MGYAPCHGKAPTAPPMRPLRKGEVERLGAQTRPGRFGASFPLGEGSRWSVVPSVCTVLYTRLGTQSSSGPPWTAQKAGEARSAEMSAVDTAEQQLDTSSVQREQGAHWTSARRSREESHDVPRPVQKRPSSVEAEDLGSVGKQKEGQPQPWRRILWARQPYPDNYVSPDFLSSLRSGSEWRGQDREGTGRLRK